MSYSITSGGSSIFSTATSVSSDSNEVSESLISLSPTLESASLALSSEAPSRWWHAERLSEVFSSEGCVAQRFSCGGCDEDEDDVGPDDEILADKDHKAMKSTKQTKPKPSHVVVDTYREEQPSPGKSKDATNPAGTFLAKYHKMKAEANKKQNNIAKFDTVRNGNRSNMTMMEDLEQGNHRGWGSAKKNSSSTPTASAKNLYRPVTTATTTTIKREDILKEWDATDDDEESLNISIIEDDDEDTYDGTLDDTLDDTYDSTFIDDETMHTEDESNTRDGSYPDYDSYNEVVSTLTYAFSDSTSVGTRANKHDSRNDQTRQSRIPDKMSSAGSVSGGYHHHDEHYYAKQSRSFGSVTTATASMSSGSSYGTAFNNKKGHRNGSGGLAASYLYDSGKKKKAATKTGSYRIAADLSRNPSNISEESSKKIAAVRSGKMTPTQRSAMVSTRKERLRNVGRSSIHSRSAAATKKQQRFPYNIDHSGFHDPRSPQRMAAARAPTTAGRSRTGQ